MKLIFAVLVVSLTMGLTRCYKTEGFYIYWKKMNNMQIGRNSVGLHQNCTREITVNVLLGTGTRVPVSVPVGYPGFQIPESPSTIRVARRHASSFPL